MENAADALKMAAFVLLFVGALSIAMMTLNQARSASQMILTSQDDRTYYSYVDENDYIASATTYKTERTVKLDAMLPTLYRYYKENYRVEFYKLDGSPLNLYINKKGVSTNALDIDDEMQNYEYWQGSPQATKEHLDKIVKEVLLMSYSNSKFKEELGIKEKTNNDSELLQDITKQTKRIIRYTVIN